MGNLGFEEVLVVVVIALLVFGPDRLPELARNAGKALARFKSEASKSVEELKRAAEFEGFEDEIRQVRREVDGIRSSVTGAFTGTGSGPRPADRPPPTDPEAT